MGATGVDAIRTLTTTHLRFKVEPDWMASLAFVLIKD